MPDTSHWITKVEAASLIGVSTKSIESFANAGKLRGASRARPGKPPITVYDPKLVAKLRKAREPEILPAIPAPRSVEIVHSGKYAEVQWAPKTAPLALPEPAKPPVDPAAWDYPILAAAATYRLASMQAANMRLWINLKEAAMLTGLPESMIRRWVREGKMQAWKTGAGWRIKRELLELETDLSRLNGEAENTL